MSKSPNVWQTTLEMYIANTGAIWRKEGWSVGGLVIPTDFKKTTL